MQQFGPDNSNDVSAQEAKEILATWANKRQARGVDPDVNSVPALAAGLGVSEEEIRQMLEDIRVHKRSHEIAAGILDHQQKERKRSDVNAAIVAAIILVAVIIIGAVAFFLRPVATETTPPPAMEGSAVPEPPVNIPPVAPVPGLPGRHENSITHAGKDGHIISFSADGLTDVQPDGNILNLGGQAAIDHSKTQIQELQKKVEGLRSVKDPSKADKDALVNAEGELDTYQKGLKMLQDKKS